MRCGASWSLRVRCRGFRQSQRAAGTSVQSAEGVTRWTLPAGSKSSRETTEIAIRILSVGLAESVKPREPISSKTAASIECGLVFASVVQETARALYVVLMLARVNEPSLRTAADVTHRRNIAPDSQQML